MISPVSESTTGVGEVGVVSVVDFVLEPDTEPSFFTTGVGEVGVVSVVSVAGEVGG